MNIALNLLALQPVLIIGIAVGAVILIAFIAVIAVVAKKKKSAKPQDQQQPLKLLPYEAEPKTEEEPVVEETAEEAEPEAEEAVEEVAEEPVAEETVEEVEPEAEEVTEEVTEEPVVEETAEELEPEAEEVTEEVTEEPVVEETAEEAEPEAEEVTEEVTEEPVVEETAEEAEPEAEEVTEEVTEEPVVEETAEEVEPEAEEVTEEVTEEPVVEETAEEAEPEAEDETEEGPEEVVDAEAEEDIVQQDVVIPAVAPEGKIFLKVRYNRSLTAKLIQSDDTVKNYYSEIKNELMRYGVKDRISWRHETFRKGRNLLVRMTMRGKTLCVYFALNPADYADTKYKVDDVSAVARNAAVPTLYRIKNDRRCRYAKQLIADVMAANGLTAGEECNVDYAGKYPYEELEPLIERKLVKLLPWKEVASDSEVGVIAVSVDDLPPELLMGNVSVAEAEDMFIGDNVEALVKQSGKVSDKTKKAIVNIDTLGRYFKSGETVTVEEIKKRIPDIGKKVTYIKVLARGVLDKALTVEADDFSPAAIKMIVLTGGSVIRTVGKQ